MKIRPEMLAALVALNTARDVLGKDAVRDAKKTFWDNVRTEYKLDPDTKYKVEMHGDLAGELRYGRNYGGGVVPSNDGTFVIVGKSDMRFATIEDAQNDGSFSPDYDTVAKLVA